MSGEDTLRVNPPKNAGHQAIFAPPPVTLEAMRWFRHGMLSVRILDQFLFYYIALESIAKHVPGVVRGPRRDAKGKEIEGRESKESASIKYLLQRRGLPFDARRILAEIRGKIAHGNTDLSTVLAAHANMTIVQRLAIDGIALVYGIDPTNLRVMEPNALLSMAPQMSAAYTTSNNPISSWGGFLSEAHTDYVTRARKFVDRNEAS
jgi:hypothetical protein